ncbi:hypothetical protein A2U01_0061417, partial [Trifolium medium]|nr:hypothetical protein [Trifolium medium]
VLSLVDLLPRWRLIFLGSCLFLRCLVVVVLALRPRGGASIGLLGFGGFWSVC